MTTVTEQTEDVYVGAFIQQGYARKAIVPAAVAKKLGLQHKDKLTWSLKDEEVIVKKVKPVVDGKAPVSDDAS